MSKMGLPAALAVAALLTGAPRVGWAADDVPKTTGAFVAYCGDHLEACQTKIAVVEIANAMDPAARAAGNCIVPRGVEGPAAAKAIIGWLGGHPELAGGSTRDGIETAIKAIWNCRDEVESGVTSLGSPDRTGAFVAFCAGPAHRSTCADEILTASLRAYIAAKKVPPGPHCTSPNDIETPELTSKVLAWLGRHAEVYGRSTEDGIAAAIDALWPCHAPARGK